MERQRLAIFLVITGLIVGIVGNAIFYNQSLGLSVPFFVSIFIAFTLLWAFLNQIKLSLRKLWLIIPIIFFSIMLITRATPVVSLLNGLAILSLMALFLYYLNHEAHVDNVSTPEHLMAGLESSVHAMTDAGEELSLTWKCLGKRQWGSLTPFVSIARGLLFAIPIVVVFVVLFSSADAVFSERVANLVNIFAFDNLDTLGLRIAFIIIIAWLSTGLMSFALSRRTIAVPPENESVEDVEPDEEKPKQTPPQIRLNMTETTIILLSVVLLFAFFVFIQLSYFFGSEYQIVEGLTYSEYARRGFFELLAVSLITLGLMLALDHITLRQSKLQHSIFRLLSVVMVALTFVIMASAWRRMYLYEEAYGFTYLRVYPHVFMVWLGILLGIALLHLFRLKRNLFAFGLLLVAIGYLGTLNLMNIDNYIATRNIERYHNGEELDICYLRELSVDALPTILDLYNSSSDEDIRNDLGYWLERQQWSEEKRYQETSIFEFHFAHDSAWTTLQNMKFDVESSTSCFPYWD